MERTLRPLGSRVLLEVIGKQDSKTEGGIFIPDNARGREDRAKVVATGPGRVTRKGRLIEPRVKKGDIVIFDPHRVQLVLGPAIRADASSYAAAGSYALVDENEILAVVEE